MHYSCCHILTDIAQSLLYLIINVNYITLSDNGELAATKF